VAIEVAINSRHIVQAEDETGALTPAHFLIGERLIIIIIIIIIIFIYCNWVVTRWQWLFYM